MLAKHSIPKKIKGSILQIAAEAQEAKRQNPNTIDGTIGMLFDEDGKLMTLPSVKDALKSLSDMDNYSYSTTSGGKDFSEAILEWTFQDKKQDILSHTHASVIATPGGSGALGIAMANYLNPNEYLITSDLGWGNYNVIANENYNSIVYYHLFDDEYHFNMKSFKETVEKSIAEQGRAFIIINDPCHNPTGYALSKDEWKGIIEFLNGFNEDIILLLDMAYIDYLPSGLKKSREVFELLAENKENILTLLAFSGSKTYSVYGMRLGALIGLSKSEEIIKQFFDANEYSARGRWSNVNHGAISMVSQITFNSEKKAAFEADLVSASKMLSDRARAFTSEANECGLFSYPYKGGFFLTIPCRGQEVYEALRKENIFTIPLATGIRISLSALSLANIKGLAKKIKEKIK